MAIDPLNKRIDQMAAAPDPTALPPDLTPSEEPEMPEPIQVAGVGSKLTREILEPLTRKGARAVKEPKLLDDAVRMPQPPAQPGVVNPAPPPVAPAPATVKPAKPKPQVRAADVTDVNKVAAERERMIAEGEAQARPPETPISSAWTDNDGLAATIRAAGESAAKQDPSMSIRSMYMRAVNAGIPEQFLKRALAGESMEATVGGSKLAEQLAGAVTVHDESAMMLDDLFAKMAAGQLDDAGKLDLRLKLAQHKIIVDQLKGIQTDVARSLNVFKRVKDKGPGLATKDIRAALDELGANQSDSVLYQLAEDYLSAPTRAGKNALVEVGLGAKLRDVWFHTYQAHLLNDPQTHAYNLSGSSIFGSLAPIERSLAVGIGKARQMIPGSDPDRYMADDILAGLSGVKNGILDGWELAKEALKRGGESKFSDAGKAMNPVSAEYLSDTPIRLFGKEVYRTPDLRDTWLGKALDGLGFVQDALSFKPIAAADEFVGGIAARYQLHEEAWRFANKEYDRLIASGMAEDAAKAEVSAKVGQLLTERPRSIQENMDGFRRMITLQDRIEREGILGETYYQANNILNLAPVKVIVPFSKTITNLFNEGSSYIPMLNTLSPRFYDLWAKGGRHRDVAIARLAMGGSAAAGAALLTLDNRLTGSGPTQTEDRKALEALGWQPHSLVFDKGEISEENLERLRGITKVAVGPDKVYVSYARFDPVSMILALGANMGDAAKFDRHPDREDWQVMAMASMTATAEYMGNLPLMQGIGELLQIARSRSNDAGEKTVQIFDALAKQYANFVYTGTPGVGMTNSTLMAHIERLFDPTRSNTKSPEMDAPPVLRAFQEAWQRIMSRIPGVSANVQPLLDNLGRESKVRNRGLDYWANWSPIVQASEGKFSEADEILVSLNFGITNPSETWDGVRLSADQINRFKKLYGQEILDEGMNLEQRIIYEIRREREDSAALGDETSIGKQQNIIKHLTEQYRQMAKLRMVGDPDGNEADVGLSDVKVEFPELGAKMRKNRIIADTYGK
jgi:hypothetical protein